MNGHNRKISTIVKDQYLVKLRPTDTVQAACLRMPLKVGAAMPVV